MTAMVDFTTPFPVEETEIRLEDYLDDKLQSTTDLADLDSLLASVELQRSQLQTQLDDAMLELEAAQRHGKDRQHVLLAQINDFNALHDSIAQRQSDPLFASPPDAAIRRLEKPLKQLHSVDLALDYLLLLQDVEALRAEARSHLPRSPKEALGPYARLKQLVTRLGELQGPADGAAAHLVEHVERITETLWDEMKKTMWGEYEAILTKRGWPNVDAATEVDDEWREGFEKLVDLQVPEVLYSPGVVPLLPIDVMAQIFVKEFRYHFMSERKTSDPLQVGELCFPWFLDRVEKWEGFMRDNFGYVLASRFEGSAVKDKMVYMDPVCALITSLLPVMREKIEAVMVEALRNPAFLSSLMAQLMKFDEDLRSMYGYDGGDVEKGWGGLASEVLEKHFDAWLQAEKEFALDRFKDIMDTPDARNIDFDYNGSGKTKPTYGAVRVTELLQSVTTQYEPVRRFSHKLRFLIDIQLEILDMYHERLLGSLEAYSALTSTVGRTLHGVTKEQLAALEGTGGFETLCKVFGSADHVVTTLKDWSNEEFFITLWEQLQTRAKNTDEESNLAGPLSYDRVKDRTSAAMGTDDDDGAGMLFDETILAYSMRRKTAQENLVAAVIESQRVAFRPYLHRPQWTTVSDGLADTRLIAITAELDEPLRVMRRNLEFLTRALSTAVFRRVLREALEKLQDTLWSDILMRQSFTTYGAAQFMRDVHAICALVERFAAHSSGAMASLVDAVRLLNLPLESDDDGSKEWGGEEAGEGAAADVITLKKATDRVFTDNAEAKAVLRELGVDSLTPANARQILQRRVENAE